MYTPALDTPPMESGEPPSGHDTPGVVEIAGSRVDFSTGEMVRDGRSIRLAPKVAETLRVLVGHRGRMLGKEELLAAVWPDTIVGDDALWRCISELRIAFGDNAEQPAVIETLPRRGYRLIAPVLEVDSELAFETPRPAPPVPESRSAVRQRFSAIRWRLAILLFLGVSVLLWMVVRDRKAVKAPNAKMQDVRVAHPRFEATSEETRGWLEEMERARGLFEEGRSARYEEGFTAVGFNALIRSGAGAETLPTAIEEAALALDSRGRLATALEGYQTILNEDPQRSEISRRLEAVKTLLATVAAELEPQRAAIVADPTEPAHWVALGKSHRLLGERSPALLNLAEALRLDPNHLEAKIETARVHLSLGSLDEARRISRRALELDPQSPPLLLLAAEIELLDHNALEAADYLDRACLARRAAAPRTSDSGAAGSSLLCWTP